MSAGLREATDADLDAALEQMLTPRLLSLLQQRDDGHCARISDLDAPLAAALTRCLRSAAGTAAQVHVLGEPPHVDADVAVSSTKLIELRNPPEEGQHPPLLVLVPPGLRTSAEDSFDITTFEELALGDVYADLAARLRRELPAELGRVADELLAQLEEQAWPGAKARAQARYLLTLRLNDFELSAAGAAVFELGMIPDFELFDDPAQVRARTARNLAQVRILADTERPERHRVAALDLSRPEFRRRFAAFAAYTGLVDVSAWTRPIAINREHWDLGFHRWPLVQERSDKPIGITVADPQLPRAGDRPEHAEHAVLSRIRGQAFLPAGGNGHNQLPVSFNLTTDPRRVPSLARFTAHLVAEDSGATEVSASVQVSTRAKTTYQVKLTKLRKAPLEQGWYFLRVLPYDTDGLPLPAAPALDGVDTPNESARFFVLADDEEIDEPEPGRRPRTETGLTQALRRREFTAVAEERNPEAVGCEEVYWGTKTGQPAVIAALRPRERVDIPLAPALADLQARILATPELLTPWHLPIEHGRWATPTREEVSRTEEAVSTAETEAVETLTAARAQVFAAIRGTEDMVVEGRDLRELEDPVRDYAHWYAALLETLLGEARRAGADRAPGVLRRLSALLRMDTAEVDGADYQAVLVAPTHPLRMLWLVGWSALGRDWLRRGEEVEPAVLAAAHRSLLGLSSAGFPLVIPRSDGRLAMAAGELTAYWGVCLPSGAADPPAVMSALADACGLPSAENTTITGAQLADRVEHYLRLHPYITTLVLSAVNAGKGEVLADMLVDLQRRDGLADVHYDLRLYSTEPGVAGNGEALARLLRGDWGSHAAADVFCTRGGSTATAKLTVALRPLSEFTSAADGRTAHLSVLFDAFGGEHLDTARSPERAPAPVHGLMPDLRTNYGEADGAAVWHTFPRHGPAVAVADAEDVCALLAELPERVSAAAAAVATGQPDTDQVPRTTLSLDISDSALLHQAHRSSDWVITIDRTLGAEYFDSPRARQHSGYILDIDTLGSGPLGRRIVTSSRTVEELGTLLGPVLKQHGFDVQRRHTAAFFDQLRLLSGALAFKLASAAANQRSEVLGLGLARLFLDYQGVLADQILIPLDAHLELYADARDRRGVDETVGLRRTDLALFAVDARQRVITCRLVEVKCYSSLAGLGGYGDLKNDMVVQLMHSERILREHFDPHRQEPDRPDRAVRNAELAALLGFYLDRAERYRTMSADAAREARWFLDRLDHPDGYRLEFTRSGLVFDLAGQGSSQEDEGGVEFHRIGRDQAIELIDAIPTEPPGAATHDPAAQRSSDSLSSVDLGSLPRLTEAGFRAPERSHEVPEEPPLRGTLLDAGGDPDEEEGAQTEPGDAVDFGNVEPENTVKSELTGGSSEGEPAADVNRVREAGDVSGVGDRAEHHSQDPPPPSGAAAEPGDAETAQHRAPEVFLGSAGPSPQYGVIGEVAGRQVALDLNETHTISLFGVQGGGKSYTLGTVIEAASLAAPPVTELPHPLATIVFHYSPTMDYAPEFTSMVSANDDAEQCQRLRTTYGVEPAALSDVVMLAPEDQVEQRRADYPGITVLPLKFGSAELSVAHWRFLMGAVGNQSTYLRQVQRIMRLHRRDLRLETLRQGIEDSPLSDSLKQLARQRLDLAAEYIDDTVRLTEVVRPGRMIVVDLRDELIDKDDALGLFLVLMQLFAEARDDGQRFNKLVVFDEAHKYIDSPDLLSGLVESVREMRHKGMSVLVASQDPPSVPLSLIELSDHMILHKFTSPAWLKHLQKANASLGDLSSSKMAALTPGEAYVWAGQASDASFTRGAVRLRMRPRLTRHGGATRTAVANDDEE